MSKTKLSKRQEEVLVFLQKKLSNKEIAAKLNIAERTVKYHVSALMEIAEVSTRHDLIGWNSPTPADEDARLTFNRMDYMYRQIAKLAAAGLSLYQIDQALEIGDSKGKMLRIYMILGISEDKLGRLGRRDELIRFVYKNGLMDSETEESAEHFRKLFPTVSPASARFRQKGKLKVISGRGKHG